MPLRDRRRRERTALGQRVQRAVLGDGEPERLERSLHGALGRRLRSPQPVEERLVDRVAVDRMVDGETNAPIGPDGLRVPLLAEEEPVDAMRVGRLERQTGRAPDLFRRDTAKRVGDVDFAALQHRQPRRLVDHRLEHEPLDARSFAPVLLPGFEHELHSGS